MRVNIRKNALKWIRIEAKVVEPINKFCRKEILKQLFVFKVKLCNLNASGEAS